mgnify:CR=1 FL=1
MDKRLEQMKAKEQLTSEYVAKRLNYNSETGVFTWKTPTAARLKPGDIAGTIHKTGYVKIILDGISYWAHRLAWLYYYKEWPKGEAYQIDHINGNKADNRICNLRLVTNKKNTRNHGLYKHNISGTSGVCFNMQQGKWQAYIRTNEKCEKKYKQKHLGYFLNYEEAVAARKQAEKEYGYTVRKEG